MITFTKQNNPHIDKSIMEEFEKQIAYAKKHRNNMPACYLSGTDNCPWDDNPNIICWSVFFPSQRRN